MDADEVSLSLPISELATNYNHPPARQIQVEESGGQTIASTLEPSGYDDSRIVVHRVNVDKVKLEVQEGDDVQSSENVSVGVVKRYDATTGSMLIRQPLPNHELLVPVTAVERVDRRHGVVYLVLAKADLARMQHSNGVDLVLLDRKRD